MFYIIETNYVGPNQDQHIDADTIDITSEPGRTNMSKEVRLDGWLETTGDWMVYAHGEYPTIDDARAAISEIFGAVRGSDPEGSSFMSEYDAYDNVVERYKPGQYAPMNAEDSIAWVYEGLQESIRVDTTDDDLENLAAGYEANANEYGYTLDCDLVAHMKEYRQNLRDEEVEK